MKATKQSIIIESYGKNWDKVKNYVDGDGWIKSKDFSHYQNINGMSETPIVNIFGGRDGEYIEFKYIGENKFWRPSKLHGLEDNNGWDSIEDENTASIKDNIYYDLYDAENDEVIHGVQGIFFVLSLIGMPCITHIRISRNKKPLYK